MKNLFRKKLDYNYSAVVTTSDENVSEGNKIVSSIKGGTHFLARKVKNIKRNKNTSRSDSEENGKPESKIKNILLNKSLYAVVITFAIGALLLPKLFSSTPTTSDETEISVKPAKATTDVNRTFKFPLKDENGEQVGELQYEITKAELMDELVVQGKRATAVEGRTFLILTLKIKNELNQSLEINTKDYVRLSVNGNKEEWLAPDIHNDPVKVQAISTKNTRLGFPINDSDKDLVLRIGEIKGEKEEVPVDF